MKYNIRMIKKKFTIIIFTVLLMTILAGCEKWIDPDLNNDPSAPSDVTIGTLLPALEANTAYRIAGGNEILRTQAIWLQQLDGIARQSMAEANYILNPSDIIWIWNDAYAEMLMDSRMLKQKAIETGSPYNSGIVDILTAFILGQLTDIWNEIPWREALQGQENLQPHFDSQQYIYGEIQRLLNEAIVSLSEPSDPYGVTGDYIYSGDRDKWIRAAHALKARYAIHLSRREGQQAFQDALAEIPQAFNSSADDMQFNYGTGLSESNPLHQFCLQRGDVRMGAFFVELLKSTNDPRLVVFATTDAMGAYSGSAPGSGNEQASWPGVAVAAPDAPGFFITYCELLFIKAEAMYQTDQGTEEVRETLLAAVTASLEKNGVMDDTWMENYSDYASTLSGHDLLREIMTQKYIATFYQPEAYHSWRRTGIPELTSNPNGVTANIPRRYPYPTSEQIYNPNMPSGVSITDRVWWDAE